MGKYRENSRAEQMFNVIRPNVNFTDATVVDIGCGYGDLALLSAKAGANVVQCYDRDPGVIGETVSKLTEFAPKGTQFGVYIFDANSQQDLDSLPSCDIAFCTSVLPYLDNRDDVLLRLSEIAETTIIEMQYFGDGPGPVDVRNDSDMRKMLGRYWPVVKRIGQTYTGRTPPHRAIWLCKHEGNSV